MAQSETTVSLPELGLIAGTRGILGIGLGLLLADRFDGKRRRSVGWTLLLVGALSTIPLAMEVLGGKRLTSSQDAGGAEDMPKNEVPAA